MREKYKNEGKKMRDVVDCSCQNQRVTNAPIYFP